MTPRAEEPLAPPEILAAVRRAVEPVRRYHDYRVEGLEHVPSHGPALIAISHSLATYDGLLLASVIFDELGRTPAGLGDDALFRTPLVKSIAHRLGVRRASPANAEALLDAGRLVFVAPGGMREALRPSSERYQVRWERRKGFVRVALRAGAPIILAACPAADDLYEVRSSRLTDWFYENLKLPMPLARGAFGTPMPSAVNLVHYLSEPIVPPARDPSREREQVDLLHEEVVVRMKALMTRR